MAAKGPVEELQEQIANCACQLLDTCKPMDFQIILGKLLEKAEVLKLYRQNH